MCNSWNVKYFSSGLTWLVWLCMFWFCQRVLPRRSDCLQSPRLSESSEILPWLAGTSHGSHLSHASFWPAPAKSGTTVQDRAGGAKIYNCPRTAAAQCCFIDNNVRWRKLICGRNSHCAMKLMWRLSPHLTCSDDLVSHVNFSWESQKLIIVILISIVGARYAPVDLYY